ncbi:hypothetical protein CNMCM8980_002448 [Aspergillus fumigatiaffinis]|nr:hypothetical protein CNMCM5878_003182 [Aspergillus fumigatiaffinis]KAF4218329.1 hypothetical protein CNMCM6457_003913 [Aspergillus fumigatiaffinis]KAF4237427.1 hypothetical protein CNMCM8980_002448 [Aspergillus fumigatiaffinis]
MDQKNRSDWGSKILNLEIPQTRIVLQKSDPDPPHFEVWSEVARRRWSSSDYDVSLLPLTKRSTGIPRRNTPY